MKKYFRLILVLVSTISLIALLFYRHEYNRLRYVLEVLNFFGKPGELAVTSDCIINGSLFSTENTTFADSVPVWHRLSNDLYVYSAFWEDFGKNEHVKAIGVGRNPSNINLGCRLWYENQELSSEGRVSYSVIPMRIKQASLDKEKVFPYYITCAPEVTLDVIPFAVEFYLNGYQGNEVVLPVDVLNYSEEITNTTVICIAPNNRKISLAEVTEFIAYHQMLGVTQFLIYDVGLLTPSAILLLKEKIFGFRVNILPWNFPFTAAEASMTALHSDCLQRSTSLRPAGILQLSWHQLAVPQYHHTLGALVRDFDSRVATARFLLPNLRFCLEYPEQVAVLPLRALRFVHYADTKPSEEQELALERPHLILQNSRTQQRISRGIITIHSYEQCGDGTSTHPVPPRKYDNSMARFLPDLQVSKLLKYWRQHNQGL